VKMSLSYRYLDANLDILESLGFPRTMALESLEVNEKDLHLASGRLSLDRFQMCLSAAAEFTSDRNIGLRMGDKFRVGTFGSTGRVYGYCENLEEVMIVNNLYQKIAIDAGVVEYMRGARGAHLMCFRPYYSDFVRYRQLTDMIMASFLTAYRWLSWGSGEDIISVRLPYVAEKDFDAYSEILKTSVTHVSEYPCLHLSEIAMSQKITTHNPERLALTRIKLDKILSEQLAGQAVEDAIEAAIRSAIDTGRVSADIVAKRMGISSAALRAQLAKTNEGIRPRIDRIRKALFIEKFEAGHSFSQIAIDLAYNDQAAMNRAFKRWFDMTPSQWRAQHAKP